MTTVTSPVWWTRTTALAQVLPIRPSRPMRGDGPDAGDAHIRADAHAETLAACLRFFLHVGELVRTGHLERAVERRHVVARVVGPAESVLVRELVRLHHVLPADVGGRHADLARERVDEPFDEENRFHATCAAGGSERDRVGKGEVRLVERVRNRVGAGDAAARQDERRAGTVARRVGAEVHVVGHR